MGTMVDLCQPFWWMMGGTGIYAGLGNKVRELEFHKHMVN
jgi:hypothetical protein